MATATGKPVVFVHGLWLHASSWQGWIDLFRERGYAPTAPGWPGDGETVEETRAHPEPIAQHGLDDVVGHYATIARALEPEPILVGHSFGGLIVQRLLSDGLGAAGVGIDAAPIKGVFFLPPSALRVASVALRSPANRKRAVSLTRKQFRYGFGNAISAEESDELYDRWTIPSPGKTLFEAATANLVRRSPARVDTSNATRGPLLLTAGGKDRTVPRAIAKQALRLYRRSGASTDYKEFPDRGHTLALDHGWRDVAEYVLGWLRERSL